MTLFFFFMVPFQAHSKEVQRLKWIGMGQREILSFSVLLNLTLLGRYLSMKFYTCSGSLEGRNLLRLNFREHKPISGIK